MAETQDTQASVDLDKLRDEKMIPLAKMVINDLAVGMIPSANVQGDFKDIVMKILQRSLDADCNITTENPYLMQLITTVFGQLTTVMLSCDMVQPDDIRYAALSKEVLSIIATEDIAIGATDEKVFTESFTNVKVRLNEMFAREKLTFFEVKYIMTNIMQSFSVVQDTFSSGVQNSVKRMEEKILGIADMSDLTMKQLDAALVKPE